MQLSTLTSRKIQTIISDYEKRKAFAVMPQTVDKVHGICRGFFFIKVPQTQYLSGLEALFLV
jgi:hypothetical protein